MTLAGPARGASAGVPDAIDRAGTLPALLAARAEATPDGTAFVERDATGAWMPVSWRVHAARAERLARAFAAAGVARGDRVGILAATSVRWELAQSALFALGAVVVGIDPGYPDATCAGVMRRTGLRAVLAGDRAVVERLRRMAGETPILAVLDPAGAPGCTTIDGLVDRSIDAVAAGGPRPDDAAIVVFSSGTTGEPKGIAYSHAQVLLAARALVRAYPDVDAGARLLCWLPLANLFQRILDVCATLAGCASWVIADPRDVMTALVVARPHLFIGVPKLYERIDAGMRARIDALPGWQRKLTRWAIARGTDAAQSATDRAAPDGVAPRRSPAFRIADRLVLSRLRGVFGGEVRYLVSGSAPLAAPVAERFAAIGLPILEAYGVSESIVPIAVSRPGAMRRGAVGKPLPEGAVKIAADGEILVGGPGRFGGYLGAAPFDGWWPTGDLGALDAEGFLHVTGRRGDAFKTATGRWVQPHAVEARLAEVAGVEHAVVFGRGRAGVVALLVFAADAPIPAPDALAAAVAQAVVSLPAYARPLGVVVTRERLTVAAGDLTANLKLRRGAIEQRFATALDALDAHGGEPADDAGMAAALRRPVVLIR